MAPEPVTVVGAGLVGSLWSIFLAQRGLDVTLLERRPDVRREARYEGRSINLAISERGLHALRQVGLEKEALDHSIPMRGRMMHPVRGELAFQAYGKDDSQVIRSISRGWLNRLLLSAAEATGRVRPLFRHRVTGVDFHTGRVRVADEAGAERWIAASRLFGADGASSAVREAMLLLDGHSAGREVLGHGYKELTLPSGAGGAFRLEKHALHIWPRKSHMLIALPNEDGSFTCTLFLPLEGTTSFQSLSSPERVEAFFRSELPDALPLLPDLAEQFFSNPTGHMVTVKATPWNQADRALLIGDAAHAIVPFYGQGMNCGFEDCVVLDRLLESGDWARAFERFSDTRKVDADAISDMAVENFVEMRDKVADPRFLLEKQVEKRLLNAFPGEFLSRYTLVSFSLVPYWFAQGVGERADSIVHELAAGCARAEDVDMDRAARLIRERLVPFIKEHGHGPGASR